MEQPSNVRDAGKLAAQIEAEIRALPVADTARVRAVRREYSRKLKGAELTFIFSLTAILIEKYGRCWLAYEFIRYH